MIKIITEHMNSTSTSYNSTPSISSDSDSKKNKKIKKPKPTLKGLKMHIKPNKREFKKQGQVKAMRPLVSLPQKRF